MQRNITRHEREQNHAMCSNMDATRDDHPKSVRKRQIPYDITYLQNLRYDTDEPVHETETVSRTPRKDWWLSRGRALGGGME